MRHVQHDVGRARRVATSAQRELTSITGCRTDSRHAVTRPSASCDRERRDAWRDLHVGRVNQRSDAGVSAVFACVWCRVAADLCIFGPQPHDRPAAPGGVSIGQGAGIPERRTVSGVPASTTRARPVVSEVLSSVGPSGQPEVKQILWSPSRTAPSRLFRGTSAAIEPGSRPITTAARAIDVRWRAIMAASPALRRASRTTPPLSLPRELRRARSQR